MIQTLPILSYSSKIQNDFRKIGEQLIAREASPNSGMMDNRRREIRVKI